MDQVKSLLQSRTVWANVIGFAALCLPLFGMNASAVDTGGVVDAISQMIAGGSFVASTFFRIKATKVLV